MEYIFDDEVGEIGSEVDAYCQKCRTEGPHTVITRYEEEVRQVQCATCGHVHAYKPIRPEGGDEEIADLPVGRRRPPKKLTWEEAMRQPASAHPRAYGFREAFRQGEYLDHPKFGRGYVVDVVDDTKIEAVFKDGPRVLVHNRPDPAVTQAAGGAAAQTGTARARPARARPSRRRPVPRPEPVQRARPAAKASSKQKARAAAKTRPARATKRSATRPRAHRARTEKPVKRAAAKPKPRRKPRTRPRTLAKAKRPARKKSRR